MSAPADPDAVSVRLLPHAQRRHGSTARTVAVDSRSFGARSVTYSPNRNHHHHVCNAAHDAAGGNGSGAAENDEHHDARHAGPHELEPAGGPGFVLVRGPADRDRAAVGNESHIPRPGDAKSGGEASKKEREIAVRTKLSAASKPRDLA